MRLQDVHKKNLYKYKLWVLTNQVKKCKKYRLVMCDKLQLNRWTGRFDGIVP